MDGDYEELNEICDLFLNRYSQCKSELVKKTLQPTYNDFQKYKLLNLNNKKILERRKYVTYDDLVDAINVKEAGDIVIYVDDAQKYLVLKNQNQVNDYFITLSDCMQGLGIRYQIVFGNEEQKLMFGYCSDEKDANFDKINIVIKDLFNVEPVITYNEHYKYYQIVINKLIPNYSESFKYYVKFQQAIQEKHPNLFEKCKNIVQNKDKNTKQEYIYNRVGDMGDVENFCNYTMTVPNVKKFPDAAKYFTINYNQNINNNGDGIQMIGTNSIVNKQNDKNPKINIKTEEWVNANLPIDMQSTTEYYESYKEYMNNNKYAWSIINLHVFTTFIKTKGFRKIKKDTKHVWST